MITRPLRAISRNAASAYACRSACECTVSQLRSTGRQVETNHVLSLGGRGGGREVNRQVTDRIRRPRHGNHGVVRLLRFRFRGGEARDKVLDDAHQLLIAHARDVVLRNTKGDCHLEREIEDGRIRNSSRVDGLDQSSVRLGEACPRRLVW